MQIPVFGVVFSVGFFYFFPAQLTSPHFFLGVSLGAMWFLIKGVMQNLAEQTEARELERSLEQLERSGEQMQRSGKRLLAALEREGRND